MATWGEIRAIALALPGVSETHFHGDPWLTVGSKGFVQTWRGRVLRPQVFSPMIAGRLRWSWVEIGALEPEEAAALVREAWAQVVPKKVSRALSHPQ